ncbi:5-guanidino-2-oxopentanoate decarboxylase [Gymnodinialimonas sp. 2305UL16-5]|uniref:5-guanidino-2-oxopentanoate decarboxylase n=1 Tax=Gymnodinialimonas mytili TaxID=3126503 RepID=UPI0030B19DA1
MSRLSQREDAMAQSVGEALITLLERRGVDVVFGIPGVHTVEMYRGLDASTIRHITPRHELSAGFMADGYARATGRPGVCLLITGPGVTNAITAMAQARADSVPMLVISGVNRAETFGQEEGYLHELPDQGALMRQVAILSQTLFAPEDLPKVVDRAFAAMWAGRPGPVHIEVPLDVMHAPVALPEAGLVEVPKQAAGADAVAGAAEVLAQAKRPLILAGGGAVGAAEALVGLAEALDAPVVNTTNGRGILGGHPLRVPASPSSAPIRQMMAEADVILAVGTQFGPTDYDMYGDGGMPDLAHVIRIDCDAVQVTRGLIPDQAIIADAGCAVAALASALPGPLADRGGVARAAAARQAAFDALDLRHQSYVGVMDTIRAALPGARIVGDSTQVIYAGNMYADIDQPRGWFNAATGYGALGYAAPAAIGAALGDPQTPVVCLTGDGGLQFSIAELGSAVDEGVPVIFLVWNNNGYQEIEQYMIDKVITPVGVTPSAPDFVAVAQAYGMAGEALDGLDGLSDALRRAQAAGGPYLIDLRVD